MAIPLQREFEIAFFIFLLSELARQSISDKITDRVVTYAGNIDLNMPSTGNFSVSVSDLKGFGGVYFSEGESKSVDDILEDATPGRVTKGKTDLYEKQGDYNQAVDEFDSLNPTDVKNINSAYGPGKTGKLEDGRTITARPGSSDGRPTLEIRYPSGRGMEIRYGEGYSKY